MTKPTERTNIKPLPLHRQRPSGQKTPVWWWCILAGGSIAIHAGLAAVVLPIAVPSNVSSAASSYTSIDLVNLPKVPPPSGSAPTTMVKPTAKSPPASAAAPSTAPVPAPPSALVDDQGLEDQAIVWSPPRPNLRPSPQTVPSPSAQPSQAASLPRSRRVNPSTATASPAPSASPLARSATDRLRPPVRPLPQSPQPAPQIAASPLASPSIGSPIPSPIAPLPYPEAVQSPTGLPTERIQVPIPDVTASVVPPPTTVSVPSPIAVSANIAPIRLTANFSVAPLPEIDRRDRPDVLATPKAPNQPPHPECLRLVTAEAEQFFGRTVAMQVATDVTGQVTDTHVQRSSDSREYDALAQCIVKRWAFVPAQKHHRPVPSTAQLISITIGRG